MMFQIGARIIHPSYGAGTVIKIEKLPCLGSNKLYYSIELLDDPKTHVWIPIKDAEEKGMRHPTSKSQLNLIWRVLRSEPETLSRDHRKRLEYLQEKLHGGDIFQIVEVVRDMFWKDHRSNRLTIQGRRLYKRGLWLLTGEVAAVQGCDFAAAQAMISDNLGASLAAKPVAG
jgi:RNA polymerase-interacting CarD/CdnL/TRCF family regulator